MQPSTLPSGLAAGGSVGYGGTGGAATTPDGSAPRPSKPMVKLFWPKMNHNQVKDTVWSKVTPNSLLNDSDFLSLEEEFGMADAKAAGGRAGLAGGAAGGAGGAGAGPKRSTKPILLGSMQRGQNVNITIAGWKMTVEQVKAAIQQLMCEGTCALDEDKLEQLEKLLPTKEECKLLSAYKGPLSELHDGEAFLVEMTSMPYLGQTLQAIKLMRSFDPRIAGLMQNIGTLVAACSEVTESKLLLLILKIALEAGNFLNSGATQGLAMGFQLDYLLKLKDVRSTKDKGVTLIHFMARAVKGMMPEDCNLKEQLQHCKDAARVDFKAHKKEVNDLKAALRTLQAEVLHQPGGQGDDACHDSSSSSSRAEATFKARTSKFIQDATTQIDDVQVALGDVETSLREMGRYLNGPTNRLEHSQLFETLYVFAEDLSKALQQNEERAAQAAKQAAKQNPAAATGQPPPRTSPSSQHQPGGLHSRDKLFNEVKAFGKLKPNDAKTLLTEKGSRERLKERNITMRQSLAAMSSGLHGMRASMQLPASGREDGDVSHTLHEPPQSAAHVHPPPLHPPKPNSTISRLARSRASVCVPTPSSSSSHSSSHKHSKGMGSNTAHSTAKQGGGTDEQAKNAQQQQQQQQESAHPSANWAGAFGSDASLRRSVHSVLQQQFRPKELLRLSCQGGLPRGPTPSATAQHPTHTPTFHQHQHHQQLEQPEPATPCPREKPSSAVPAVSTIKEEPTPPNRGSVTPVGCSSEAGTPQATPPPPPKPTPPSSLLGTRTHMLTQRQIPQAPSPFTSHAYTPTQHRPRASSVTSSDSSSGGFATASAGTDIEEGALPSHMVAPTNSTTTTTQQQQQQPRHPQTLQAQPPSAVVSNPTAQPSVPRANSVGAKNTPPTHHTLSSKPARTACHARNAGTVRHDLNHSRSAHTPSMQTEKTVDDNVSSSSSSGYGGERSGTAVRRGRLGARLGSGIIGGASVRTSMTARLRRSVHGIGAAAGVAATAGGASGGGGARGVGGGSGLSGTSTARAGARGGPWGGASSARARAASGSGSHGGKGGVGSSGHGVSSRVAAAGTAAVPRVQGPKGGGATGVGIGGGVPAPAALSSAATPPFQGRIKGAKASLASTDLQIHTKEPSAKASPPATTPRMTALSAHKKPAPPPWTRVSAVSGGEGSAGGSSSRSSIGVGKAGEPAETNRDLGCSPAMAGRRSSKSNEAEGDAKPLAAWVTATPGGAAGGVRARRLSGVGKPAPPLRPTATAATPQIHGTPINNTPPPPMCNPSATTPPLQGEIAQQGSGSSSSSARRAFLPAAPSLHVRTTRSGGAGVTGEQGQEGAEASTPHCGVSASPTHFSKLRGSHGRGSQNDSDSEHEGFDRARREGMVGGGGNSSSSGSVYEEISPAGCSSPPYSPADPQQDNLNHEPQSTLCQAPQEEDHQPQQHGRMPQPGRCTAAAARASVAQSQCLQSALATEAAAVAAARFQQVQRAMHERETSAAAQQQQQQQMRASVQDGAHQQQGHVPVQEDEQQQLQQQQLQQVHTSLLGDAKQQQQEQQQQGYAPMQENEQEQQQQQQHDGSEGGDDALASFGAEVPLQVHANPVASPPSSPMRHHSLSNSLQRGGSSNSSTSFTNGMVAADASGHTATATAIAPTTPAAAASEAAMLAEHAPTSTQALLHDHAELREPQAAPDMQQQQQQLQPPSVPQNRDGMQEALSNALQPSLRPSSPKAMCATKQPQQTSVPGEQVHGQVQGQAQSDKPPLVAICATKQPRTPPRPGPRLIQAALARSTSYVSTNRLRGSVPTATNGMCPSSSQCVGQANSQAVRSASSPVCALDRASREDPSLVHEVGQECGVAEGAIHEDGVAERAMQHTPAEGVQHIPVEGMENATAAVTLSPAGEEEHKGVEDATTAAALLPPLCEEMQSPELPQEGHTAMPSPIQHQNSPGLCLPSPSVGVSQMEWSDRSGLEKQMEWSDEESGLQAGLCSTPATPHYPHNIIPGGGATFGGPGGDIGGGGGAPHHKMRTEMQQGGPVALRSPPLGQHKAMRGGDGGNPNACSVTSPFMGALPAGVKARQGANGGRAELAKGASASSKGAKQSAVGASGSGTQVWGEGTPRTPMGGGSGPRRSGLWMREQLQQQQAPGTSSPATPNNKHGLSETPASSEVSSHPVHCEDCWSSEPEEEDEQHAGDVGEAPTDRMRALFERAQGCKGALVHSDQGEEPEGWIQCDQQQQQQQQQCCSAESTPNSDPSQHHRSRQQQCCDSQAALTELGLTPEQQRHLQSQQRQQEHLQQPKQQQQQQQQQTTGPSEGAQLSHERQGYPAAGSVGPLRANLRRRAGLARLPQQPPQSPPLPAWTSSQQPEQQGQRQQHHHHHFLHTPKAAAQKGRPMISQPASSLPPCPPQVPPQTPETGQHSTGPTPTHTPPPATGGKGGDIKPVLRKTSGGGRGVGATGGACSAGQQQQRQQQQQQGVAGTLQQRRRSSSGTAAHNSNTGRGNNSNSSGANGMNTPSPQAGGTEGKEQKQLRTAAWLGL